MPSPSGPTPSTRGRRALTSSQAGVSGAWNERDAADLSASLHQSSTKITANRNEDFIGETQRILIEEAQPGRRLGASADVRLDGGIGARFSVNHIGAATSPFIFEEPTTIDAAAIADMEVTFIRVGGRILVGLGANNLFDRLPAGPGTGDKIPSGHLHRSVQDRARALSYLRGGDLRIRHADVGEPGRNGHVRRDG